MCREKNTEKEKYKRKIYKEMASPFKININYFSNFR